VAPTQNIGKSLSTPSITQLVFFLTFKIKEMRQTLIRQVYINYQLDAQMIYMLKVVNNTTVL